MVLDPSPGWIDPLEDDESRLHCGLYGRDERFGNSEVYQRIRSHR